MKKILVTYPSSLFPTEMMSQKRAIMQIIALNRDNDVKVITFCKSIKEIDLSKKYFSELGIEFKWVEAFNFEDSYVNKAVLRSYSIFMHLVKGLSANVVKFTFPTTKKRFISAIKNIEYDAIISHYWYSAFVYSKIDNKIKLLDLHNMEEEDYELNKSGIFHSNNPQRELKERVKSIKLQKEVINNCDFLIPNSLNQVKIIKKEHPITNFFYCPNGQDLSVFSKIDTNSYDSNTILFYGSMGGRQNIRAFDIFYENVWPIVLNNNSLAKLLLVGNNPPKRIKDLNQLPNIKVTGYVDDIPATISKTCCMILPMDIAVGFRGRMVEVMASGVPIIGNHNALDCIGIVNKENGFVTDDYEEMANYALRLMKDDSLRNKISSVAKSYVFEKFTLDATFGELSKFLNEL